jgi:hypothetical protein
MGSSATPGPEIIESGSDPAGPRLRPLARKFARRVPSRRVLVIVVLLLGGVALGNFVHHYRQRLATQDRVSLATGSDTSLNVDLATRTLLLGLSIENASPYVVTLDSLNVQTAGLVVEPRAAGTPRLPVRLPPQDVFQTMLQLRPDCTRLPTLPAFRVVATSTRGHRHAILLPAFKPLAQLWTICVRSACSDKPQ